MLKKPLIYIRFKASCIYLDQGVFSAWGRLPNQTFFEGLRLTLCHFFTTGGFTRAYVIDN